MRQNEELTKDIGARKKDEAVLLKNPTSTAPSSLTNSTIGTTATTITALTAQNKKLLSDLETEKKEHSAMKTRADNLSRKLRLQEPHLQKGVTIYRGFVERTNSTWDHGDWHEVSGPVDRTIIDDKN